MRFAAEQTKQKATLQRWHSQGGDLLAPTAEDPADRAAMEAMNALFDRIIAMGMVDEEGVGRMRENVRTRRFSSKYYMTMWTRRLSEHAEKLEKRRQAEEEERARPERERKQLELLLTKAVALDLCDDESVASQLGNISKGHPRFTTKYYINMWHKRIVDAASAAKKAKAKAREERQAAVALRNVERVANGEPPEKEVEPEEDDEDALRVADLELPPEAIERMAKASAVIKLWMSAAAAGGAQAQSTEAQSTEGQSTERGGASEGPDGEGWATEGEAACDDGSGTGEGGEDSFGEQPKKAKQKKRSELTPRGSPRGGKKRTPRSARKSPRKGDPAPCPSHASRAPVWQTCLAQPSRTCAALLWGPPVPPPPVMESCVMESCVMESCVMESWWRLRAPRRPPTPLHALASSLYSEAQ